jgi:hypothetical protein
VLDEEDAVEDREILDVIQTLAAEDHWLRGRRDRGVITAEETARLREVETRLGEMWTSLRERRAAREAAVA